MKALLAELAPRLLGALVRRYGDLALCEDALQEALLAASAQWPTGGVPDNPRAWLLQVARRRLVDFTRSDVARRERESFVVSLAPAEVQLALSEQDDTLELFFMCAHPALSSGSASALTLRALGGLSTAEIARAYLVPEATMAQRLSRARQTIRETQLTFERLEAHERAQRLGAVMRVVYLIFNEGYLASGGDVLARVDLSSEAIRLGRLLLELTPEDPELEGLLALMLLTDARRAARTTSTGELVPLDVQDRALWDGPMICEGSALIERAFARGRVGAYQLQAAIAALHDTAPSTERTDWPQILTLYDALLALQANPMVALNRAIAFAMVHGPRAGLALLDEVGRDARLADHHRLWAARAHLLERAGDSLAAHEAFARAAERTGNAVERDYLRLQAARLAQFPPRKPPPPSRPPRPQLS